ncbi:hypothetical protein STEG23_014275, partial [Scotinomys teguina]
RRHSVPATSCSHPTANRAFRRPPGLLRRFPPEAEADNRAPLRGPGDCLRSPGVGKLVSSFYVVVKHRVIESMWKCFVKPVMSKAALLLGNWTPGPMHASAVVQVCGVPAEACSVAAKTKKKNKTKNGGFKDAQIYFICMNVLPVSMDVHDWCLKKSEEVIRSFRTVLIDGCGLTFDEIYEDVGSK